jgi:hypothetical protein
MRSELQDSIEQDIKGNERWLYYSILMLSHETWAIISELSISYSVRLDQVLLLSSKVITLVFAQENQSKRYREIHISDLPNLKKQGIDLHFKPFLKQMLEAGKYGHGDDRVPHQPPVVQSITTLIINTDEEEESNSTVEGVDCVGSDHD